ncbi:hypothetical protein MPSEU_000752900 [Mayamaea pseudoterrestris]|nr:hypothetical protein MPSEU_000752900 [Mayamaea pseudoterrestris]
MDNNDSNIGQDPFITNIASNDILFGTTQGDISSHPGNVRFQEMAARHLTANAKAARKPLNAQVAMEIVAAINAEGGRFLFASCVDGTCGWTQASNREAFQKTFQLLDIFQMAKQRKMMPKHKEYQQAGKASDSRQSQRTSLNVARPDGAMAAFDQATMESSDSSKRQSLQALQATKEAGSADSCNTTITEFTRNDVLLESGSQTKKHEGNICFRELVCQFQSVYEAEIQLNCNVRQVVRAIVSTIKAEGGRFLRPINSNTDDAITKWTEVSDFVVMAKTEQAIRDLAMGREQRCKKSTVTALPHFDQPAATTDTDQVKSTALPACIVNRMFSHPVAVSPEPQSRNSVSKASIGGNDSFKNPLSDETITDINIQDVLVGNDKPDTYWCLPGNKRFYEIAGSRRNDYVAALRERHNSDKVAKEVVAAVKGTRGRFLHKILSTTGQVRWLEMTNMEAVAEAARALQLAIADGTPLQARAKSSSQNKEERSPTDSFSAEVALVAQQRLLFQKCHDDVMEAAKAGLGQDINASSGHSALRQSQSQSVPAIPGHLPHKLSTPNSVSQNDVIAAAKSALDQDMAPMTGRSARQQPQLQSVPASSKLLSRKRLSPNKVSALNSVGGKDTFTETYRAIRKAHPFKQQLRLVPFLKAGEVEVSCRRLHVSLVEFHIVRRLLRHGLPVRRLRDDYWALSGNGETMGRFTWKDLALPCVKTAIGTFIDEREFAMRTIELLHKVMRVASSDSSSQKSTEKLPGVEQWFCDELTHWARKLSADDDKDQSKEADMKTNDDTIHKEEYVGVLTEEVCQDIVRMSIHISRLRCFVESADLQASVAALHGSATQFNARHHANKSMEQAVKSDVDMLRRFLANGYAVLGPETGDCYARVELLIQSLDAIVQQDGPKSLPVGGAFI